MKYLLLFTFILTSLNASKILSYNIYDRTDRADVMITFDTPFDGIISQSSSRSKIIIKLSNAFIETTKFKKLSSPFLHSINIIPMSKYTQIIASVSQNTRLVASKTSDGYGLRLRFKRKELVIKNSALNVLNTPSKLPTKKETQLSTSYYIVVGLLFIGIVILIMLKKKLVVKNGQTTNNWLFKENQENNATTIQKKNLKDNFNSISIRFQKDIDKQNSVVMLDFLDQSYLVLMGNSNILLDKFTDNKPTNQEEFESILQNRHQELENFLNQEQINKPIVKDSNNALQAYQERAASMIYEQ